MSTLAIIYSLQQLHVHAQNLHLHQGFIYQVLCCLFNNVDQHAKLLMCDVKQTIPLYYSDF